MRANPAKQQCSVFQKVSELHDQDLPTWLAGHMLSFILVQQSSHLHWRVQHEPELRRSSLQRLPGCDCKAHRTPVVLLVTWWLHGRPYDVHNSQHSLHYEARWPMA